MNGEAVEAVHSIGEGVGTGACVDALALDFVGCTCSRLRWVHLLSTSLAVLAHAQRDRVSRGPAADPDGH